MYNKKVMEMFLNPVNVGVIRNADAIGEVGNAACGDIMKLYLKIENNIITDVKFQTFGCAAAIVSTSLATQMIKGKTIEEALKVTNDQILKEMGQIPRQKIHCSVLAEEAIHSAIEDYNKKQAKLTKKKAVA